MIYEIFAREGLIRAAEIVAYLDGYADLSRAVMSGQLIKLRRGAYVTREHWDSADDRSRHILRARAVAADSSKELVFAGFSAAAAWGVPIRGEFPVPVTVLEQWTGGGRSQDGVRKTARGQRTALVERRSGLLVTSLARTVLDIARVSPFDDAVAAIDWARSVKNPTRVSGDELGVERAKLGQGYARVNKALGFSTELSESFGESVCRAGIHHLGFAAPELQVRLSDAEGEMYPDFCWRRGRVLGEFDGKVKYTLGEYTAGDPSAVVWREKLREDRLRRLGWTVVRITWADVTNPRRLERLLSGAGVPRGG